MGTRTAFFLVTLTLVTASCAKSLADPFGPGGPGAGGAIGTGGTGATVGSGGSGGAGGSVPDGGTDGPIACLHASDCAPLTNACNKGDCLNNICVATPTNELGPCDDGLYCTDGDTCTMGVCVGTPKVCSGADSCHVGTCDETTKACTIMPGNDGALCSPTDPCFTSGSCVAGTCMGDVPADCSFLDDACNTGKCDAMQGCTAAPMPDMTMCDDGLFDPCSPGACMAGVCQAMPLPDNAPCNDGLGDACNPETCLGGTCTPAPGNEGGTCDDGLFCTINDSCHGGMCAGKPNPCTTSSDCQTGLCDEGTATCQTTAGPDGVACSDGDVCNAGKTCKTGSCVGGTPANNGMACTPVASCIVNTTCMAGVCGGGTGPTIYFGDDFHDSSKGWMMDTEWQIGPAMASSCATNGNQDPAVDHTPTADNGIAGIVIGGCEDPLATHPYYYLTSPPFDTSVATGSVFFGFYRWLNSDYAPYMTNTVEVYDGTSWISLFTSGGAPAIQDAAWTYYSYDVTAHKNAKMQVRFGYQIGSTGVFTVSSWNVDDVLVASAACP